MRESCICLQPLTQPHKGVGQWGRTGKELKTVLIKHIYIQLLQTGILWSKSHSLPETLRHWSAMQWCWTFIPAGCFENVQGQINTAILLLPHPYFSAAEQPALAHASSPSGVKTEWNQKDFRKYKLISRLGSAQFLFLWSDCRTEQTTSLLTYSPGQFTYFLCTFSHRAIVACLSKSNSALDNPRRHGYMVYKWQQTLFLIHQHYWCSLSCQWYFTQLNWWERHLLISSPSSLYHNINIW